MRSLALEAVVAGLGEENCRTALTLLSEMLGVERSLIVECLELMWRHGEVKDGKPVVAYTEFYRPKKSGGRRQILAPVEPIKKLLSRINREILCRSPLPRFAHGFRTGRWSFTNAKVHFDIGANYAGNWDIKDCFPSTPLRLVKKIYWLIAGRMLLDEGCSRGVADAVVGILTTLSTVIYGRSKVPVLPMGAPTSPALLNLVLTPAYIRVARALSRIPGDYGFSGYGDDWTVSSSNPLPTEAKMVVPREWQRLGYRPNRRKTRMMQHDGSGPPIEVTGLILGRERILLPDEWIKKTELWLIAYAESRRYPGEKAQRTMQGRLGLARKLYAPDWPGRLGHCLKSLEAMAKTNPTIQERLEELFKEKRKPKKVPEELTPVSVSEDEPERVAEELIREQPRDKDRYVKVPLMRPSGQLFWDWDGGPGGMDDPFVPEEGQPEQGDWEGE